MKQEMKTEEQFTTIPCIREETIARLAEIMRRESIVSFDKMLQELIDNWDMGEESRRELSTPEGELSNYLDAPSLLEYPENLERFEALKRMHPAIYENVLAHKQTLREITAETIETFRNIPTN